MNRPIPDCNIGPMLLDISRSDGVPARTAVVLGSIENAYQRLLRAADAGLTPTAVAGMALEEIGKIFNAKAAYDKASAISEPRSVDDEDNGEQRCTNPGGHQFECTGTAYGGDDERWHGEGRCLCIHCGADGDA